MTLSIESKRDKLLAGFAPEIGNALAQHSPISHTIPAGILLHKAVHDETLRAKLREAGLIA